MRCNYQRTAGDKITPKEIEYRFKLLLEDREIVTTEDEIEFGGKIIMTNGAKLNVSKSNRKRIRKLLQGLIV